MQPPLQLHLLLLPLPVTQQLALLLLKVLLQCGCC
jgi:hypothetical protein